MDHEQSITYAKKYLEDILSFFGLNTDVAAHCDEDVIELSVPSTFLNGFLIGQRGETLKSLQFTVSMALKNQEAEVTRVNIDVADYKKQRAERLGAKVREWAETALETGEPLALEPMNAADRRIVHHVIGEFASLSTKSEGESRDRHVVIFPSDEQADEEE